MPLPAQAKLLRVLQEGTVEPLGTNESTRVDVRIISATHRNLRERIREGRFREDLYYRLNVLDIEIPPLRERRGDLPLLLQYFLNKFTQPGKPPPTIVAARLGGAVAVPRSPATCASSRTPSSTRSCWRAAARSTSSTCRPASPAPSTAAAARRAAACARSRAALKEFEHEYLLRALAQANGKKMKAAEILGISRKNLWEKLRLHGIAAESRSRGLSSNAAAAASARGPSQGQTATTLASTVSQG